MLALLSGCAARGPLERFESKRVCMGVQTRIVIYAPERTAADAAANAAYDRIADLEGIMSDYRPGSELMRLCGRAGEGPVAVSPDLFEVLRISRGLSRDTHGAFDVTVGPAVALWREARKSGKLPGPAERARAMSLVGWEQVRLDERARTVALSRPGMRLDLGGIGKGYAAQRAVEEIRARGLARCLVALAGDIVVGESPPGREGWEVEIAGGQGRSAGAVLLANAAVSTSGDTEQFVELEGRRYSHIMDPRTGLGIEGGLSATVIAPRGELADALSTAVCVLGREEGERLVRARRAVAAVMEWKSGPGVERRVVESGRALRWAGGRR
ncbi:MAG: FAD:protein FMN transferase [Phycisphaerales bacterium]|nr:FAD:protein FMN transferase [Phycisphaerales bacterium]